VYTLLHHLRTRQGLLTEVPAFLLSWIVAEMFYKFHSFTLECAAFLATWLVLSFITSLVIRVVRGPERETALAAAHTDRAAE
jgi:hypothetical protein